MDLNLSPSLSLINLIFLEKSSATFLIEYDFAEDIEYTEEEIDNGFFVTELESIRNSVFN